MRRALVLGGIVIVMGFAEGAGAAKPPKIVDGVIAIVGSRPILFSELRQRMAFARLDAKPMLERMIDEHVMEADGAQISITITPEEVDDGMRTARPRTSGMTEQDHRDEVRRKIYEQKWLELRIEPRLKAGANRESERRKRLDELRHELDVEVLP